MRKEIMGMALLASLTLAGCSTMSEVDESGHTNEPVFPELDSLEFKAGSYPNLDNLRQIQAGVTRDQLYELIGRPHFTEGFRVREWDYLFNFNTPEGVKQCQYKVLFDKDMTGQSFYWKPAECAQVLQAKTNAASAWK